MKKFSSIMKESSRRTSRKKQLKIILSIGLVGILIFILVPRLFGFVSSVIFEPISKIETWAFESSSVLPSYFRDRSKLIDEIDDLNREIAFNKGNEGAIELLQKDNIELRGLLGNDDEPRIVAGVIGRPPVTPYDVLVLDKGRSDNIVENAPVYIGSHKVIGYVSEVYENSSIVVLATTPGVESTVYIFGPNIYTTAKGIGGGVLQVSVPQGMSLSINDMVVLPSLGGGIYGSISVVNSVLSEPEQRGYLTLDVPLQSIRFVSVGMSSLLPLSFEEALEVVGLVRDDLTKIPVPSGVLVDVGDYASTTNNVNDEVIDVGDIQ